MFNKDHEHFLAFVLPYLIKPSVRAPVGIRTSNLLIRSQMLYPVELRAP